MLSKLPTDERAREIAEEIAARLRLAENALDELAKERGAGGEALPRGFDDVVRNFVLSGDFDAWIEAHERRERPKPFRRARS